MTLFLEYAVAEVARVVLVVAVAALLAETRIGVLGGAGRHGASQRAGHEGDEARQHGLSLPDCPVGHIKSYGDGFRHTDEQDTDEDAGQQGEHTGLILSRGAA